MKSRTIFLLLVITPIFLFGQNSRKALKAVNSIGEKWRAKKYDKAIKYAKIIYDYDSAKFIKEFHSALNGDLLKKEKEVNIFLKKLYLLNYKELNSYIDAIYVWSLNTPTKDKTKLILKILEKPVNNKNNSEFYSLLILEDLEKENQLNNQERTKITSLIIKNLSLLLSENKDCETKAENRFLLAYTYLYLSKHNPSFNEKEKFLKLAASHSPTRQDIICKNGYYSESGILLGYETDYLGFENEYIEFLKSNNKEFDELRYLSNKALKFPTNENLNKLKSFYKDEDVSFYEYWITILEKEQKNITDLKLTYQKLKENIPELNNDWLLIDIWGTWCIPCVKELPELQSFYEKKNSNLKLFTLSFNSKNLNGFMSKKGYTFPVLEIDKEIIDELEVTLFPTKIIITPNGHFFKIPHIKDWQEYIDLLIPKK